MRASLADALVWVAVLAAWLGAVGFTRLRSALDRLHCVTFVNATGGGALLFAVLMHDGFSVRGLKVLFIVFATLVSGAVLAHATGRAIWFRERRS